MRSKEESEYLQIGNVIGERSRKRFEKAVVEPMQQDYMQAVATINQVSDIAIQHWRNMKIDARQFSEAIPNYFSFLVQNLFDCLTELSEVKMQNLVPHLTIGSVVFSFEQFKESIRNGSQELAVTLQSSIVKHLD